MSDEAFQFDPETLAEAAKLPQADTRPPTGRIDPALGRLGAFGVIASEAPVARAAFETTLDEAPNVQAYRLDDAYAPVVAALAERTGRPKSHWRRPWYDRLAIPFTDSSQLDRDAIWRDIDAARRLDPKAFAELGKREAFEQGALTRGGERAVDEDYLARSRGLPATIATFAGGLPASLARPENLAAIPIGGGAATVGGRILTEGLVNSGVAALAIPQTKGARARMGEDYTGEQMLEDVGTAAAFGVVTRGAIEAAPNVAALFRRAVPEHARLPEEAAALDVVAREEQVNASSPFEHTYQGLDQHAARLAEAMAEVEDGRLPSASPPAALTSDRPTASLLEDGRPSSAGTLDSSIVRLLERGGLTAEQARGVAAGIHAESGSKPHALNPTSGAMGLGQWLGPRKAELIRRYGTNPSLEQQVEFLLHELKGGDAAALVGGVAAVLMMLATLAAEGPRKMLDVCPEHITDGFVFAFKAMGSVLPIAGFFFVGAGETAAQILGVSADRAPSLLFELIQAYQHMIPDNHVLVAFGVLVVGMITGIDGSGFAGLPLTGTLSGALGPVVGVDPATLAAVGQMGAVWTGGGTLIAWSSLIAVAGFARVNVLSLVRALLLPVLLALFTSTICAVLIWR